MQLPKVTSSFDSCLLLTAVPGLSGNERQNPLYMSLNVGTRPEVMNNPKSTHGIGEYFLYGSWRGDMNEQELKWVKNYQNYMGNFIRTGNPNGMLVAPSFLNH